jgi:hypothetical protein
LNLSFMIPRHMMQYKTSTPSDAWRSKDIEASTIPVYPWIIYGSSG